MPEHLYELMKKFWRSACDIHRRSK